MALPPFPPSQLHPVLNHIPIVLLPLAALLATLGRRRDWAWRAAGLVVLLAAAGAVLTVVTGLGWAGSLGGMRPPGAGAGAAAATRDSLLSTHRLLGITTGTAAVALAGLWLWKRDALRTGPWGTVFLVALWAVALLVLATAWYGGAIAFEQRPGGFGGGFRNGNFTAPPPG